uniref:Uncharacterized protein n=1 Tax=Janibacter limosus TaxID=53458 RepID=A0AC61U0X2_9MICO|nr:hypothetical protein [Janibacter limosus]
MRTLQHPDPHLLKVVRTLTAQIRISLRSCALFSTRIRISLRSCSWTAG